MLGLCVKPDCFPILFNTKSDHARPDALCGTICTLPQPCTGLGLCILKYCCCYSIGANRVEAIGCFQRFCTSCCSMLPIIEGLTKTLPRPPLCFLCPAMNEAKSDDHTVYKHVPIREYIRAMTLYEGWGARPCAERLELHRRSHDGGGIGTPKCPWLGQSQRAFAVAVPNRPLAARLLRYGQVLPDPEVIWNRLLERKKFVPCPKGANSLLVHTGVLATHEFFRTDAGRGEDGDGVARHWINANSSFLDLQSLYGTSEDECKHVRTYSNGQIHTDGRCGRRLLRLPVVKAILKLFALEHNYIACKLGENFRFKSDDCHFEQARAVLLAQFIQVVSYDYVGSINGGRARSTFERFLQNSRPYSAKTEQVAMHCSVEFKLMYQFHATIPEFFCETGECLLDDAGDSTDNFDAESVLKAALTVPSGAFCACNTPRYMKSTEIAAINFARKAGICSFNDMRRHLGLEPYTSFEELSGDTRVQNTLEELYPGGVEHLELYVGCAVEENTGWPSGWSLGKTIFTALVNDALLSGIGDYFYTHDFTKEALTDWGYHHAMTSGRLVHILNRHTSLNLPSNFDIFHVPAQEAHRPSGTKVVPDPRQTSKSTKAA